MGKFLIQRFEPCDIPVVQVVNQPEGLDARGSDAVASPKRWPASQGNFSTPTRSRWYKSATACAFPPMVGLWLNFPPYEN